MNELPDARNNPHYTLKHDGFSSAAARIGSIFVVVLFLAAIVTASDLAAQESLLPIGAIQGQGDASPYRSERVSFRGVVTGIHEDQNTRGIIYYTLFVQELPGAGDGDPATSDGLAVFFGRNRPQMPVGAQVLVSGEVTEFYGFTEIDDDGLRITTERLDGQLPDPVFIDPPAELDAQRAYFEPLEGMRVAIDGTARVVGAAHVGCGFAVVSAEDPPQPIVRRQLDDPTGRAIPVLYPTDVDCREMPQVKTGDLIEELTGILVYNFDEFKILLDNPASLVVTSAQLAAIEPLPELMAGQISAATINANDWFDSELQFGSPDEPVLPPEALAAKNAKLVEAVSGLLRCPTLIAIQEVEHAGLLEELAAELAPRCGFTYAVSHIESVDSRGIDNAFLSDPRRVIVTSQQAQQICSPVPTDRLDPRVVCAEGESPLFDRPPLQVDMEIDGRPYVAFVNHFKSKREGEAETALERLAQARFQNALVGELLAIDPALRVLVLGDLNDYELSAPLQTLTDPAQGGQLVNALADVPEAERYSYVFSGVAGLLDGILVSPALAETIHQAGILHANTDYPASWALETAGELLPYHFSDHDVPWMIWTHDKPVEPTATPPPTATLAPAAPTATMAPATPTASPVATEIALVVEETPLPAAPAPINRSAPVWPLVVGALVVAAVGAAIALRLRR